MKGYRIDATFKDKAGREVARAWPVWTGHAADAKAAIRAAKEAIKAHCTERVDRLSVHVKGEDGESVTSSEFAEDFTIGYGASAIEQSNLGTDGIEHKLTPEQEAAARERVKQMAVDTLINASPAIADQLRARTHEKQLDATAAPDDGFGGFFDDFGHKPKGETAAVPAGPFRGGDAGAAQGAGTVGGQGSSAGHHTVSAGPGCDKSSLGDASCGKTIPNKRRELSLKRQGQQIIDELKQSVERIRRTGRVPQQIVLAPQDLERVARALGTDPSRVPGNSLHGIEVVLGDDPNQPPQIASRRKGSQDYVIFTI